MSDEKPTYICFNVRDFNDMLTRKKILEEWQRNFDESFDKLVREKQAENLDKP